LYTRLLLQEFKTLGVEYKKMPSIESDV